MKPKARAGKGHVNSAEVKLPAELDFFKYAQGTSTKRKANDGARSDEQEWKKRKIEEDHVEEEDEEGTESAPQAPKHRVTLKGSNVPEPADSFEALKERYRISSCLLSNLSQNGYTNPTGIQSSGIPILLEVTLSFCFCKETVGSERPV